MKRFIENNLISWKNAKFRKPLIVRGARQVGKTFSIREFGKNNFENTILIDFEKNPEFKKVFENELSPQKIIRSIEVITNLRIIPGKSLLFFDEIQACNKAVLSLRYFYEELPELHIISAGSLLELVLGDISFPVGRVEFLWMRPMSYKEYLIALGFEELASLIPNTKNILNKQSNIDDIVHSQFIGHLKNYFFVGGMPEAVLRFVSTNSFLEVKKTHESLVNAYMQSFHHYTRNIDKSSITKLLQNIPQQIGKQIKYSRLDPDSRIEKTKSSLSILEKSLLIQIVRSCNGNDLPLGATASDKVFKIIFLDIGLMQYLCGIEPEYITNNIDLITSFEGALAEQFVGQELLVHRKGSEHEKLYYWARANKNSNAEVDYIINYNSIITPIEVKNAPGGSLKSLHLFLKEYEKTQYGIVLTTANHKNKVINKLRFYPLYTSL